MKGKVFSREETGQVAKLRQEGDSWLKIQKETGIPRRSAKRLYNQWEQSQSLEDLRAARRDVATEELRKHLNTLVDFADLLVGCLVVPQSPNENRQAEEVINGLLRTDVYLQLEPHRLDRIAMPRKERRVLRQNQMLLKSLQDHTRGKVNWEVLEKWKESWDSCTAILGDLRKETKELTGNHLDLKPGLKERVQKETGKKDAVARISEAVLQAAWWGATVGPPTKENAFFDVMADNQGAKVGFRQTNHTIRLTFTDKQLAEDVATVCTRAAETLYLGETLNQLTGKPNAIRDKIAELEEMLDPLMLRPLILRNHCDLCPV